MSIHRACLFSVELSTAELAYLDSQVGRPHGEGHSERTYVEVHTLREILYEGALDWANIGMLATVLIDTISL